MTHTGKRSNGDNGHKSAGKDGTPDWKGHNRAGKQKTSSSQSVGKDEVGGSNPPSSSKETRYPGRDSGFCFAFVKIFCNIKYIINGKVRFHCALS